MGGPSAARYTEREAFDWIVERRRGYSCVRSLPVPGAEGAVSPDLATIVLRQLREHASHLSKASFLEVARSDESLIGQWERLQCRKYTLLLPDAGQAPTLASCYPRVRVYAGSLASLATEKAKTFDTLLALYPEQSGSPFTLNVRVISQLLRKKGVAILHASLGRGRWNASLACVKALVAREGLELIDRYPLGESRGSLLVVRKGAVA
ncbi:hypothetical protein Pan216_46020 [Planctomycetes bacterium Pan216]|uniref:Uncharacterized protein n=1 Tax=Kolteria novifilia TaxID=2527975 RepID=A0A518B9R8_9BACT|nr:hypothetical protein Pan216_46020 [Planctomycetes bacterium Pan216]